MKKFLFIFLVAFLASCQNVQNNPVQNPSENPVETATGTEISHNSETEKNLQKYESATSDWPEFNRPFGEKFELDKDFCVKDICIKAGTPVYQDENGEIVQMQYVRERLKKKGTGDEPNEYSEYFYAFGEMKIETDESDNSKFLYRKEIDWEEFYKKFPDDNMLEYKFRAIPNKNYIVREFSEPFHIQENACVEVKK